MPEGWPGSEIGWAIRRDRWGHGLATEAAAATIDWAFDTLGWAEIIHLIAPDNIASRRSLNALVHATEDRDDSHLPSSTTKWKSGGRDATSGTGATTPNPSITGVAAACAIGPSPVSVLSTRCGVSRRLSRYIRRGWTSLRSG